MLKIFFGKIIKNANVHKSFRKNPESQKPGIFHPDLQLTGLERCFIVSRGNYQRPARARATGVKLAMEGRTGRVGTSQKWKLVVFRQLYFRSVHPGPCMDPLEPGMGTPKAWNWPLQTTHGSSTSYKLFICMECWQWNAAALDSSNRKWATRIGDGVKFHSFHPTPPPPDIMNHFLMRCN